MPTTCPAGIAQRDGPGVISALDRAPFDVLASAIAMPGDDGYDLIRKVRAREAGRGGQIPAFALTGYVGIEDRADAIAAGYSAACAPGAIAASRPGAQPSLPTAAKLEEILAG